MPARRPEAPTRHDPTSAGRAAAEVPTEVVMSVSKRTVGTRCGARGRLRHHPARRRASRGRVLLARGEGGDRGPARRDGRRRDRGGLPHLVARRVRVGARGRRDGEARPGVRALARDPGGGRSHLGGDRAARARRASTCSCRARRSTWRTSCGAARTRSSRWRGSRSSARAASPTDVEFSCMDATRSDPEFVARVVRVAIAAGATTINLPDTVGCARPGSGRRHVPRRVRTRARAGLGRGELPRPGRPGHGDGELAGRDRRGRAPGGAGRERAGRAGGQHAVRGGADGAARARRRAGRRDGRRHARDLRGVAGGRAALRASPSRRTRRSSGATRSATRPASTRTAC